MRGTWRLPSSNWSISGGFVGGHEAVAVGVLSILSSGWPVCLIRISFIRCLMRELLGVDHDLFGRALHAGQRLVDHDAGVGQGVPLARGAGRQQHGAHRGGLANAVGRHVAGDELHRVVDRQPALTLPPGELTYR
jgi:hypothetical protein